MTVVQNVPLIIRYVHRTRGINSFRIAIGPVSWLPQWHNDTHTQLAKREKNESCKKWLAKTCTSDHSHGH